jgi:hypothetical protein
MHSGSGFLISNVVCLLDQQFRELTPDVRDLIQQSPYLYLMLRSDEYAGIEYRFIEPVGNSSRPLQFPCGRKSSFDGAAQKQPLILSRSKDERLFLTGSLAPAPSLSQDDLLPVGFGCCSYILGTRRSSLKTR